jgi:hypothetical protein
MKDERKKKKIMMHRIMACLLPLFSHYWSWRLCRGLQALGKGS